MLRPFGLVLIAAHLQGVEVQVILIQVQVLNVLE